jgi:hypothetical protein
MTGLDVLLAIAGLAVMAMVIAGMVLITPGGAVDVHAAGDDPPGSNLSAVPAPVPEPAAAAAAAETPA